MKLGLIINNFIIILFQIFISNQIILRKLDISNEIILTIKGKGDQPIISSICYIIPEEILVNGNSVQSNSQTVNGLTNEYNKITIKWNSPITNCDYMFSGLNNIIKIDLSNFDSSSVTSMKEMFYDCEKLTSLNLESFKTSSVNNMELMFGSCKSLISLDLSSFNTSLVTSMNSMFIDCESLESLDLYNFNTSNVEDMYFMFKGCKNLMSLNINSFVTSNVFNMDYMFQDCSKLISLNLKNFNLGYLINGIFNNININLKYCIRDDMFDRISTILPLSGNNCTDECFQESIKVILEESRFIYNCSEDTTYKYEYNKRCYKSCPEGTHNSTNNNYLCEKNNNNQNNNIYIENEITDYITDFNKYYISNSISIIDSEYISDFIENSNKYSTIETVASLFTDLINKNKIEKVKDDVNIENDIIKFFENFKTIQINESINSIISNIIEGKQGDLLIKENNTYYQITSTYNQKNKTYDNFSSILFEKCENILKKYYNISENQTLLILKFDYFMENTLIPIIDYEVFNPNTKEKLNLSICNDSYINLNIPVEIDEDNIFKYDPNSEYYTDECFPYTTKNGTDILLNDRQNEYNNNNMSVCENNFTFKNYDKNSRKVECECIIKKEKSLISNINQSDILHYNFTNKDLSSNMVSMKCVYTLFTKDGISRNIANYILLFFIIILAISGILFYKFGYYLLESDIKEIIESNNGKNKNNIDIIETNIIKIKGKKKKIKKARNKIKIRKNNIIPIYKKSDLNTDNHKSSTKIDLKPNKDILTLNEKKVYNNDKKLNDKISFNDFDLDIMSSKDAIVYDKRNYFSYYIYLIRIKHPVIFAFCPIKDYNSKIIKIDLLILYFSLFYFFNALFFDETTIHKIYVDEGIYNFIYLIPFISYSFILSHILGTIIKYFSLSERNIGVLKYKYYIKNSFDNVEKVKRCLVIKYICFFISSISFLLFLWYYLSSFGAIYQNTQVYLIKNTIISFGFSFIYPFIINLLVGFFRLYSLKKHNREFFYKISKVMKFI